MSYYAASLSARVEASRVVRSAACQLHDVPLNTNTLLSAENGAVVMSVLEHSNNVLFVNTITQDE